MADHMVHGEILTSWRESSGAHTDRLDRQAPLADDPKPQEICVLFTAILRSARGESEVRNPCYDEAKTRCGLPSSSREEDEATQFFFHCALSAVSAEWTMVGQVEREALEWLLSRLFKDFPREFSAVASCALVHLASSSSTRDLSLSGNPGDKPVEFAVHANVRDIVARMIRWCHREWAFQSRLPLQEEVKHELTQIAGEDLFVFFAPTGQKRGFEQAAWKVQLLWRNDWLRDKGFACDDQHRSIETADILELALRQEGRGGIRDQDLEGIVSYVLKDESSDWVQSLLGLNPTFTTTQPQFRGLIACLAVKSANNAYVAGDMARATAFIGMLCKCPHLLDDDLEVAARSMAAGAALSLEAVKALRTALSSDPRGLERLYLWVCCLEHSMPSDRSGRVAEIVKYLDGTGEGYDFKYLKESGRKVSDLFTKYRPSQMTPRVWKEMGGAFMRWPPGQVSEAFLSALGKFKGVQGEPWISEAVLHLQGPRAVHVLSQLAFALEVLAALGVRHEEDALRVLLHTPTLMVPAREPGVTFTTTTGRPCLTGDVQWLQSLILDLASHAPSLACLVFLSMTPQDQWTMLTSYPPAFDVLTVRINDEADRESLLAHFQWGLASEMKKDRDPRRVEVWVGRCPLWAEATLYNILRDSGLQTADQWPIEHPKLRQVLERWEKAYSPKIAVHVAESILPLTPDPEALLARHQPDAMLWRVRSAKYLPQGGLVWRSGVRYIRHQFHEILRGVDGPELQFGNAVEMINYLRREDQADLFFASAFIVVSSSLKNGTVHVEALDWLLDRLHRSFARHFSIVASFAFTRHLPLLLQDRRRESAPEPKCRMHLPWGRQSVGIHFARLDHVTQTLTRMIVRCRADQAFQSRLPLREEVKLGLMKLSQSKSPGELLTWLASPEAKGASWKVQLLSRDPRPPSMKLASDPTADILKQALVQDEVQGIREEDLDDIVAYVLDGASADWTKWLLEKYPADQEYRRLVVRLVVKCASKAYDRRSRGATELIALLCESKVVTGDDFRVAASCMTAPGAIRQDAITELARLLFSSKRAQQRMCLWVCHLSSSARMGQAGDLAKTVQQLDTAFKNSRFKHLDPQDRGMVQAFFERYRQEQKLPT